MWASNEQTSLLEETFVKNSSDSILMWIQLVAPASKACHASVSESSS